jgi:membrane associated rhomboid family serine protease
MFGSEPICTYLIIALTVWVSYLGFRSLAFEEKYIFNPEYILAGKEFYRLVTSAFLHADWMHLIFNMYSLYAFARWIELFYRTEFLIIYFGSIAGGSLLSLFLHRHHLYRAYGASGGVCGVIFAYILLFPGSNIRMFYLPFGIPAWLYAIGFIIYSFWGMKENNRGNVGHDAHLGGAILGLLIAAGLHPEAVRANPKIFLIVFIPAVLLAIYLWRSPMFLPLSTIIRAPFATRKRRLASLPKHKRESLKMDAILDKISKKGIESLTSDEKALLDQVSDKYRRRSDSKKPESGLAI